MNRRAKFAAEEALSRILAEDSSSEEEVSDIEDTDDRESSDDSASEEENVSNDDSDDDDTGNDGWRAWRDSMDIRVQPFTVQNVVRMNPLPRNELDFFNYFLVMNCF